MKIQSRMGRLYPTPTLRATLQGLQAALEAGPLSRASTDLLPIPRACSSLVPGGYANAATSICKALHYVSLLVYTCLDEAESLCLFARTTARVSLKIAYGYAEDQAMLESAVHATEIFSKTAVPGMWLVDIIPLRGLANLYFYARPNSDSSEVRAFMVSDGRIQEICNTLSGHGQSCER